MKNNHDYERLGRPLQGLGSLKEVGKQKEYRIVNGIKPSCSHTGAYTEAFLETTIIVKITISITIDHAILVLIYLCVFNLN